PVQGERQLGVHGLLGPQRAVVVEHGDAVLRRDEVGRIRVGHGGYELPDRPLCSCLTPARQPITAPVPPPSHHRPPPPSPAPVPPAAPHGTPPASGSRPRPQAAVSIHPAASSQPGEPEAMYRSWPVSPSAPAPAPAPAGHARARPTDVPALASAGPEPGPPA